MKTFTLLFTIFLLNSTNIIAQVEEVISNLSGPDALTIVGDFLYIVEYDAGKISKIDLTSPDPVAIDIVSGLSAPNGILINGDNLFISESSAGKVSKKDLTDPSPIAVDFITGLSRPEGLAIKDNELYIAEYSSGNVSKINLLDSIPVIMNVATGLSSPAGISIDDNYLYIAEYNGGKISRIDLTSSSTTATDFITELSGPYELAILADELFILEFTGNQLLKVDLNDPSVNITTLVSELNHPDGIVVNGTDLYFSEYAGNRILKLSLCPNTSSNLVIEQCDPYTSPISNETWTSSGNYTVVLENSNGCDSIIFIDLTIPTFDLSLMISDDGMMMTSVVNDASYQWLDCDNSFANLPGETSQSFTPTNNGSYAVEINQNNCKDTTECLSFVNVSNVDLNLVDQVSIFPNPTNGSILIEFSRIQKNTKIQLVTTHGQVLKTRTVENTHRIQLEVEYPSGLYFVKMVDEYNKQGVFKLMKE